MGEFPATERTSPQALYPCWDTTFPEVPAESDVLPTKRFSLNSAQIEIVRALREGLGLLQDVKVQEVNVLAEVPAHSEIL